MPEEKEVVATQSTENQQTPQVPTFLQGMKGFDEAAFKKDMAAAKTEEKPAPAATTPAATTPAATTTPEGGEKKPGEEGYVEPGNKELEIETSLFGKEKLGGKKENTDESQIVLKEFSDIEKYVKSNYGVDDVKKFLTEVGPNWRKQAAMVPELEKKNKDLISVFEKLDDEVLEIAKANLEGRDWRETLNQTSKLNLNKTVKDYSKEQLVNHYFPGKFSKEDFEDDDTENKSLDIAYEASTKSFANDKIVFDGKRAALIETENKRQVAYESSITSSVEHLQKTLPHVNELVLRETGESLKSGAQGIIAEFMNEDGTLKPDAALKFAMAKHGIQTLETYMKIAKNKAETETREEFVSKAPDKLASGNPGGENKLSKGAENALNVLKGLGKKTTY